MSSRWAGLLLGLVAVGAADIASAQARDSADVRCDSIVSAAKVDSVRSGLFMSAERRDGATWLDEQALTAASTVALSLILPRPFRLTVFSGAPRLRFLRTGSDTTAELRSPTLTGRYRFWALPDGQIHAFRTVRASLMPGLDSAMEVSIRAAASSHAFEPRVSNDSMLVDVRVSSDSTPGAMRFVLANFPEMPVKNAVASADNPRPAFPDDAKQDSIPMGDVVLRFVVDRQGIPMGETVEVVRGQSLSFLKAALEVLPKQHFTPATVRGCPVAQEVEYAFNFLNPDVPPRH